MNIEELKQQFYTETDSLLGETFKDHVRDALWTWMEAKFSNQVDCQVMLRPYNNKTQQKNLAWFLPRPKPDRYKGGMPLYAEEWLIDLAKDILEQDDIYLMNLFCGMNKHGIRIDIKAEVNPDYCVDAHELDTILHPNAKKFDVILADPPYSDEEAKTIYGTPKLNYNKWTQKADLWLRDGGLLIVYHKYVMPNPDPTKYEVIKRVFIGNRTYHLPRVAIYFRKKVST